MYCKDNLLVINYIICKDILLYILLLVETK